MEQVLPTQNSGIDQNAEYHIDRVHHSHKKLIVAFFVIVLVTSVSSAGIILWMSAMKSKKANLSEVGTKLNVGNFPGPAPDAVFNQDVTGVSDDIFTTPPSANPATDIDELGSDTNDLLMDDSDMFLDFDESLFDL